MAKKKAKKTAAKKAVTQKTAKSKTRSTRESQKKLSDVLLRDDVTIYDSRLLLPRFLVAHLLGMSPDGFAKLGFKPVIQRGTERLYYLPEILSEKIGNPQKDKEKLDAIKREKAEIELGLMKGEIVYIQDVVDEIVKECVTVRQRLLAMPNRLARPLLMAETPQETQELVLEAVKHSLKDLNYGGRIEFDDVTGEAKVRDRGDAEAAANP